MCYKVTRKRNRKHWKLLKRNSKINILPKTVHVRAYPNSGILLNSVESKSTYLSHSYWKATHISSLAPIVNFKVQTAPVVHASTQSHTHKCSVSAAQACSGKQPPTELVKVFKVEWVRKFTFLSDSLSQCYKHHFLAFLSWIGHPTLEDITRAPQGCFHLFTVRNSSTKMMVEETVVKDSLVKNGGGWRIEDRVDRSIIAIISGLDKPQSSCAVLSKR